MHIQPALACSQCASGSMRFEEHSMYTGLNADTGPMHTRIGTLTRSSIEHPKSRAYSHGKVVGS